jgi:CBS domain containing-hemolysin-like protein
MILAASLSVDVEPSVATAVLIVCLFAASFFFSGTETALYSLEKVDRSWFERKGTTGRQVNWLLSRNNALIATILMGNETANVTLATVSASLCAQYFPGYPWVNVLILPPILLLVSEFTPKTLARRFNRRWARLAVWPLTAFFFAGLPFRLVVSGLVTLLARPFGVSQHSAQENLREDELRRYIARGAAAGELDEMERDIIESVFEFDTIVVERLMTPRPDVFSLPLETPREDLFRLAREAGFSRIPIHSGRSDDILGVLLLKDLLRLHVSDEPSIRTLLLSPVFVPQSKPADTMLREFLAKKLHMAFVVDEHGTLIGLVTLDDLLDELIGELEADDEDSEVSRVRPGVYTVRAGIDTEDFTEVTSISLPEGDYNTVAGFVFHQLGRLPRTGDEVQHEQWSFVVSRMEGRRIVEVVVRHTSPRRRREIA